MNLELNELKLWATYTAFPGGEHNICVCKDIDAVIVIVRQTRRDCKTRIVFDSIRSIGVKLEKLEDGEQLFVDFADNTSMMIQKISKIVGV